MAKHVSPKTRTPILFALAYVFLAQPRGTVDVALPFAVAAFCAVIAVRAEYMKPSARDEEIRAAIRQRLRREYVVVSFYVVVIGLLTFAAGFQRASTDRRFQVKSSDHNLVLLAIYLHNTGVFGRVDTTDRLTGEISVERLDSPLTLATRSFSEGIKRSP